MLQIEVEKEKMINEGDEIEEGEIVDLSKINKRY